jgi:hypothetical protein
VFGLLPSALAAQLAHHRAAGGRRQHDLVERRAHNQAHVVLGVEHADYSPLHSWSAAFSAWRALIRPARRLTTEWEWGVFVISPNNQDQRRTPPVDAVLAGASASHHPGTSASTLGYPDRRSNPCHVV